jgi:hypothetical protein
MREQRGGPELACLGKARFEPSQRAVAVKVANRMSRHKHARLTVFRCPYCDGWHVGNDLHR